METIKLKILDEAGHTLMTCDADTAVSLVYTNCYKPGDRVALEIDQLAAGKQTDTLAMKSMREDLKAVERLRKTAEQLSRQERDKPHDRGPDR